MNMNNDLKKALTLAKIGYHYTEYRKAQKEICNNPKIEWC